MNSNESKEKMTQYSISFAIGGLLGDVFFHTMPHMSGGHEHGGEHQGHEHHGHEHNHAHDHSHSHHGHSHNP